MRFRWHDIPPFIRNKYFVTGLVFVVWLTFFDRFDLFTQWGLTADLNNKKKEMDYYRDMTKEMERINEETFSNDQSLERFAREEYLMKKKDEDIFVIVWED